MMNAIVLQNVSKQYPSFLLDSVTFNVPIGSVVGLIGENGAGKSTIIRLILGMIHPDSGQVTVLGKQGALDYEHIGVVFDENCFPGTLSALDAGKIMHASYKTWSGSTYESYLKRFDLPPKKLIKDYSRGMRMKLSIAMALSHDSQLLVLDEATSGLDPVVRDEILDIYYDFMQDEQHSILMSSHITSDLEKICDYITLIHKGKVRFHEEKDVLLSKYGILQCEQKTLETLDPEAVHSVRRSQFGMQILVERDKIPLDLSVDPITLDELLLFTAKEE